MMNLEIPDNDSSDGDNDPDRKTSVLIHEDQELEDPFRVLMQDDGNQDFSFSAPVVLPSLTEVSGQLAGEEEARRHFEQQADPDFPTTQKTAGSESPQSLPDLTAPPSQNGKDREKTPDALYEPALATGTKKPVRQAVCRACLSNYTRGSQGRKVYTAGGFYAGRKCPDG